jgi:hypothetical protein
MEGYIGLYTKYGSISSMVLQSALANLISSGRLPAHTFFWMFAISAGGVVILERWYRE